MAPPPGTVRAYPGLMFERFTDRARHVVVYAQEEARMLNHNYIGTEHILLGLIHEGEGVAARTLEAMSISLDSARQRVEEIIGEGPSTPTGHIPFTPRAKKVLELSLREALQLGHAYIGTEHILLGLIREGEGVGAQVLQELGADLNRVRQTVIQLLSGYTAGKAAAGGEVSVGETAYRPVEPLPESEWESEWKPEDAPRCSNCHAALSETLAIKDLGIATEGGEPVTVRVAYCSRCGVVLGVRP
jgi:ATP-dependent Clp protease ATP-binding subunit ClpA